MRRESLYLWDIIEAADHIAEFLMEADFEGFRKSEVLRSAVVQKLSVIGEAASRLSGQLKSRHPELLWPRIVAFRNILVHGYFGIDWQLVWQVARNRCPLLRDQVAAIVAAEFGESD